MLGDPVNLVDPWGLSYADAYGAMGASMGIATADALSLALDAGTGGANLLLTPSEMALGGAFGYSLGYALGSILDWIDTPSYDDSENVCYAKDDKMLSPGEINKLKKGGIHPHDLKENARQDLYKDKDGNIVVKPKGGNGPGEPTGLNINDF